MHVRGRSQHKTSNDSSGRDKKNRDKSRSKSKPPKMFCKYCKKDNHFIEDCLKLKAKEKRKNAANGNTSNVVSAAANNSDSGDCLIVLAGCVASHDEWILDSACSFHICTNKDWFSSFEPL